ncbi:MAG: hypothetical protein KatS3mg083_031 [Candidatus Dojkabacteria bacterium]|nr:MAG: hypothetical protein KatS3mg083_031 [Candidatus Dojkabacteria bacterium]
MLPTIEIFYATIFYLVFVLFGLIGFLVLRLVIKRYQTLLYLISKPFGLILFAYPIWLLTSFRIVNFNPDFVVRTFFIITVVIASAILAIHVFRKITHNKNFFKNHKKTIVTILLIEICSFLVYWIYLYIKSFNPRIEGTEKFMDLHLLMSAGKTDFFPFFDGWWSEKPVNYYYYGFYLFAVLTKISGVPYSIAYNLSLGIIFVQTLVIAAAIAFRLTQNYIAALVAAGLVGLAGNLHYTRCVINNFNGDLVQSCFYPKATRILDPSYTINEIPSYSFILGDLHPHVMAIPFFLLGIYLIITIYKRKKFNIYLYLVTALTLATAGLINFWDFMTLGASCGALVMIKLAMLLPQYKWNVKTFLKENYLEITKHTLALECLAITPFILYWPFFTHFQSPVAGIAFAPEYVKEKGLTYAQTQYPSTPEFLFGIWGSFLIPIIMSIAVVLVLEKAVLKRLLIPIIFSIVAIGLIAFTEIFFFQDVFHIMNPPYFRANTVFKLTYHAWILLGLFTSVFIHYAWDTLTWHTLITVKNKTIVRLLDGIFLKVIVLIFTAVFIYPIIAVQQAFNPKWPHEVIQKSMNLTLDGSKFIQQKNIADYKAIQWLNNNQPTRTVILEAAGPAYTYYGRIGVHTGMGNILNVETHEWTWRFKYPAEFKHWKDLIKVPNPETGYGPIAKTKEQVKKAYETESLEEAKEILDKYNVEYVYIGDLEREAYKVQEEKFYQLGQLVMQEGNSVLIKINRN